jgi:hypothetical protein
MTTCLGYLQGVKSAASAEQEPAGEILNPTRRAKELKAGGARSLERAALSVEVPCQQGIFSRYQGIHIPCYAFERQEFVTFLVTLSRKMPQIATTLSGEFLRPAYMKGD